jgi:hypothetical protein
MVLWFLQLGREEGRGKEFGFLDWKPFESVD